MYITYEVEIEFSDWSFEMKKNANRGQAVKKKVYTLKSEPKYLFYERYLRLILFVTASCIRSKQFIFG